MDIIEKTAQENVLRLMVSTNEESFFSLLKSVLEKKAEVELVGIYKEHHLIDKTEFYLKTKKGNALELFKKTLKEIKKDLDNRKLK